jgi:hypothetical protein
VKVETDTRPMGVIIEVIDSIGVEQRRPSLDAMDLVPFSEEELREVRPVLTGDSRYQRYFSHLRIVAAEHRPYQFRQTTGDLGVRALSIGTPRPVGAATLALSWRTSLKLLS